MTYIILNKWFKEDNKYQKWWFQGNYNKDSQEYINESIIEISKNYNLTDIEYWRKNNLNALEGILLYDQFYRHIKEHTSYHQKVAVNLVLFCIKNSWVPDIPHHLVFFLMPFRHTKNSSYINFCKNIITDKAKYNSSPYYTRFLNALEKNKPEINNTISNYLDYYQEYNDILENNIEYNTNNYIINSDKYEYNKNAWKCFQQFIKDVPLNKTLIISLSGGVDSMVFLYLCQVYKEQTPSFNFTAIHINWNQREESTKESNFIIKYLMDHNIDYIYKDITHIKRSQNRELFEKEGRKIRFNSYKEALKKWNGYGIFLGHHKGDIVENVFTNMINSSHITNLGKMKEYMIIDEIPILRPFLTIDKSDIYDVAKNNLIPFFKNTTPEWSNRGAIRDKIFPTIENQFGKRYEDGFIKMAKKSDELGNMVNDCLIIPYMEEIIKISDNEYKLPFKTKYPQLFYELMFEKFMYSFNKPRIKNKALTGWFINSRKDNWKPYTFSKNCVLKQTDNNYMIIYFNS